MKHVHIKTSKAELLVLEAPEGSTDISVGTHCIGVKIDKDVPKDSNGWHHIYSKGLFFGLGAGQGYELIGYIPDLTEEQAKEVVDVYKCFITEDVGFQDYKSESDLYRSATLSLHSLLEANGVDKDFPNTYIFKKK